MSVTSPASTITSPSKARTAFAAVDTALGWCLISSADKHTRQLLTSAAQDEGWQTRACCTPQDGLKQAVLHRVSLALVDVGSVEDRTSHADLLRIVQGGSNGLIVVCDRSDNADGELWARQSGAWVYLPGISQSSDIGLICHQAKLLTQKRQIAQPATVG